MTRLRRSSRRQLMATLAAGALVVAACSGESDASDGDSASGGGGGGTELTVMVPFPSGLSFYPLFVADARGYLDGIDIQVESAEGSAAALQQVLTGQADICMCSPGPLLRSVEQGEEFRSTYLLYQSGVFDLVTQAGSEVTDVGGLRDSVIGIDARQGGTESWLVPLLEEQGLVLDEDYRLTAVGSGATPVAAFERGEIDAYAAAYIDVAIMELRGFETASIEVPGAEAYFDTSLWMTADFIEENPEIVETIGRGTAMATVWGMDPDNYEEVLDITGEVYPEEVSDREFALELLEDTNELFVLPESADGQWGFHDPDRVAGLIGGLVGQGYLEEEVDSGVFVNDYLDAYNDFEEDDL
ncbi:ABC transporter substrate-binding protein [Georgenia sp. Z1491]|uniref:ABC transporter substrate-binding protein n=1 Tax=Georgenia sp. Z1491 TaxID=3416707 RepID=UPI003CE7232C